MGAVISVKFGPKVQTAAAVQEALAATFANHRRRQEDVFWLKENAEFLNIHESIGQQFSHQALAPYEEFYASLESRLAFFPQYYRFLISIALDLESLGLAGNTAEKLCQYAQDRELPEAELSDLQRAEAQRLLARRGFLPADASRLEARLRRFISRPETFSLPNKKAAYELTHIVFYLSEYGRRDPELSSQALQSLMFTGTMAYIDENADLLAEVCIALGYAGQDVPELWSRWIAERARGFSVTPFGAAGVQDDYHEYLMCNWSLLAQGETAFTQTLEPTQLSFTRPRGTLGVVRSLSEYLYQRDDRALAWARMRGDIAAAIGPSLFGRIKEAESALPEFEAFFAGFARAGRR